MSIDDLGREVRKLQDPQLSPERRRLVRVRLLQAPVPSRPRVHFRWAAAMSMAALAAMSAGVLVWVSQEDSVGESPLTFAVAGEPGQSEAFVSAPEDPIELAFSDGSTVALSQGSSARVDALTERGATLRIEDGRADVHVIHRDVTDWRVEAGPYTVHVVGTSFAVEWDARSEEFSVAMNEGRVEIEGPGGFRTVLEGTEELHRGGDSDGELAARTNSIPDDFAPDDTETTEQELALIDPLELDHEEHILHNATTTTTTALGIAPIGTAEGAQEAADSSDPARVARVVPTTPIRPNWQGLVEEGDYEAAREALDAPELRRLMRHGSAEQLGNAGTALRRARDPRQAQVWNQIRTRFPQSSEARDAAFHLARYAFHHDALAQAEQWLRTYLSDAPRGRWEREARGRLVEVRSRRGRSAEDAARSYLARFPDGPHAQLASSFIPSASHPTRGNGGR